MAYCPSVFSPHSENNVESFMNITDEYDPEKPNSYLLYCEKREKEEEEAQRVFMVKQQLEESEQHMIEERKKLERDIREGKIFNGIQQMGRGRGAAMTLPAWMTEGVAPKDSPFTTQ
ncbi:hypothetical protein WA171_005377 [Blastocystis sp. BT1]